MLSELAFRDPYDTVQYKFVLVPDFQPGKSVMLFKIHHCMADGMGVAQIFISLSDTPNLEILSGFKSVPFLEYAKIMLLLPLKVFIQFISIINFEPDVNVIKSGKELSGKQLAAFSELEIQSVKKVSKHMGCTYNEYTTALLVQALHTYFQRREKEAPIPPTIKLALPYSYRTMPKRMQDIRLGNDVYPMYLTAKVHPDLKSNVSQVREFLQEMKSTYLPYGNKWLNDVTMNLPFSMLAEEGERQFGALTAVVTNLNGTKAAGSICGKRIKGQFYYGNVPGKLGFMISMLSISEKTSIAITCDSNFIPEPKELIDLVIEKHEDALKQIK